MGQPATFTRYGLRNNVVGTLNASGALLGMRITNNNASALWIIRQVSLICSPLSTGLRPGGVTCVVTPPTGVVDTSYFAGTGDTMGGDPAFYCYSGEYLNLDWSSGAFAAGLQAIATYYYDEVIL